MDARPGFSGVAVGKQLGKVKDGFGNSSWWASKFA